MAILVSLFLSITLPTCKQALSPSEKKAAIELMVWEYEQKILNKFGTD
jgi:hypothetical protein